MAASDEFNSIFFGSFEEYLNNRKCPNEIEKSTQNSDDENEDKIDRT